jgi:hypothetical protein
MVGLAVRPANEKVVFYKYLYENIDTGKHTVVTTKRDYYEFMAGLKTTFYVPENINSFHVKDAGELGNILQMKRIDTCFFVHRGYEFKDKIEGYEKKIQFRVYPDFIGKLSFYNKLNIHTDCIYLITKKN